MSAAKKDRLEEIENTNSQISEAEAERRNDPDSKRRDRRVIARFNEPQLKVAFKHLKLICQTWNWLAVIYCTALVASNFVKPESNWSRTSFFCIVVGILIISVDSVKRAAVSYVGSQSQAKLVVVFEKLLALVFIAAIISVLFGGVHLASLY